jgi:hypothetical protein
LVTTTLECYECAAQGKNETVDSCLAAAATTTTTTAAAIEAAATEARMREAMSSEQMAKALDRLVSFCNTQLGDDEVMRIKIHVENVGPFKWIDFQWFLDYTEYINDEDEYKEKFGKHTFMSQLMEESEDSDDDSEDNPSEKPEGLDLWVKKMEQLEEYLAPEFRLASISFNNSFNDARGCVSTTAFKSLTTS